MQKGFSVTNWSIKNRTAVYLMTALLSLAGVVTYLGLPKERFPDIVIPTVIVSTIYPGASPTDIENTVTKPLEKKIKAISGVKKVVSQSAESFSLITVEFVTGIEVALAKQKVKDAVDKAKADIPADAQKNQQVQEVDFSEFPCMNINLSGNYDATKLKQFAEMVKDKIETNKEITRCDIIGALDREIKVDVDLYKMQAAYVSLGDIENQFAYNNMSISGGDISVNNLKRTLRVSGEFKNIQQIKDLIFKGGMGNPVRLGDIATITNGFKDRESFARLDNTPVISLNVIKRSGENLIVAADKIKATIKEFQDNKFPKDLKVTYTADLSVQTQTQLNDLINTVILGFLFVTIVLMFFMGVENAFYVGLSVPLSSLLAFLFMPSLGFSLNVIVLFAFLLALGIVVDDAIVVIENAHRIFNKDKDKPIMEAVREAAGEVFWPVFTGTLVNVAPFAPLLFWPGIVGRFMYFLPMTLIITLFASLVVAFVINPVFAVSFMKRDEDIKSDSIKKYKKPIIVLAIVAVISYLASIGATTTTAFGIANFLVFLILLLIAVHYLINPLIHKFQDGLLPSLRNKYRKMITWATYHPWKLFISAIVLFFMSLTALMIRSPKVEFFPSGDPNFTYIYCELPIGTEIKITDSITKELEHRVFNVLGHNNPLVESVISNVAVGAGDPRNPDRTPQSHKSKITVAFKEFEYRHGLSTSELLTKIRENVKGIPGAKINIEQEQNGPPTGKPINIEINGEDFDSLINISARLKKLVENSEIKGIEQLSSDLVLNKPELEIVVDKEKAQREGVAVGQIATIVYQALNGNRNFSKYRDADDEVPIMVKLSKEYRSKPEDLLNMIIAFRDMTNGQFRQIPLSSVASIKFSNNFSGINRKNQKRVVTLGSAVQQGFNANEINGQLANLFRDVKLPEGYEIKQTGEQEEQAETGAFLGKAFAAAIALMFLIIVMQFNSSTKPLIIFSSIVFSLIGVFFGYAITGQTMVIVMTGVGIMALAGIVVKNGIILIEFIDELKARGLPTRQAIIEGGVTRMTPVLLTACAAILGLIPLAVGVNIDFGGLFTHFKPNIWFGGESVTFWGPLAWTLIYGLVVATFLTLLVAPAMYLIRASIKDGKDSLDK
jgi:multidrug efflux pump